MRIWVRPLALLSGLRIWRCYRLWCRSHEVQILSCWGSGIGWQLQLWFSPAQELPYATGGALKKKKRKKGKKEREKYIESFHRGEKFPSAPSQSVPPALGKHWSAFCAHRLDLSFLELQLNKIIQYLLLVSWLLLLGMMFLSFFLFCYSNEFITSVVV